MKNGPKTGFLRPKRAVRGGKTKVNPRILKYGLPEDFFTAIIKIYRVVHFAAKNGQDLAVIKIGY